MKKKKVILTTVLFFVTMLFAMSLCKTLIEKNETKDSSLAIFIQNDMDEYESATTTVFPTDGYELNSKKTTCINGGKIAQDPTTKKISLITGQEEKCSLYFDTIRFRVQEAIEAMENARTPKGVKEGKPNFTEVASDNNEIYSMIDDYGTSYYYRAHATNNYVKFGKWSDDTESFIMGRSSGDVAKYNTIQECEAEMSSCQQKDYAGKDMYWRIIRINGDGSVRMMYDGIDTYPNGSREGDRLAILSEPWANSYDDPKYTGWMYGGNEGEHSTSKAQAQKNETDSNAKKVVDEWYKANFVNTEFEKYMSDSIFCNDRSMSDTAYSWTDFDTALGYGANTTVYGAYKRFKVAADTIEDPIFTCPQKNDAFTVSDTLKGNGALTYPVGLLTADEIVAVGNYRDDRVSFLTKENFHRTMSPMGLHYNGSAGIYHLNGIDGMLSTTSTPSKAAYSPVINIKAEYAKNFIGNGTASNPYRIE